MGIDLGGLDPEMPLEQSAMSGVQGYARMFEDSNPGKKARVKDLVGALSYSGRIVGTPESIADQLEAWQDAGIDGVNMIAQVFPESYREFIEHVIPVLQDRGLAQREYAPGTLRERLFPGTGGRLPERHAGTRYRSSFKGVAEKSSDGGTGINWQKEKASA